MIREALKALWEYRLRAALTLSILAFGTTALVGILTSLEALRTFIARNLAGLGSQAFSISGGGGFQIRIRTSRGRLSMGGEGNPIHLWEVRQFEQLFSYPGARISRHIPVNFSAQAMYGRRKTPAQVRIVGVDPSYFRIQELSLAEGRFFSSSEVLHHQPVIVLGDNVATQLFTDESPLGKWVIIQGQLYRVVGVLSRRGSLFGFSLDWECFIPWTVAQNHSRSLTVSLYIGAPSVEKVPDVIQAARLAMRTVRRLRPSEQDSFSIIQGEQLADFVLDQIRIVTLATIGISLITLLGAALSLMNILLVIVKERTHEIGLRMALGATRLMIRWQFLTESIVIALIGGAGGILLGLLIGNLVSVLIGSTFVMPWRWVLLSVLLSGIVGILAGYQPALEASRLHPVDALRYE
ncbi:MAG: ABC transporter permease [Bacteroidia bacterium]|nr:ABC transporter permease [Bacteroidia bacterium]MCX7652948.1 ABC transporter permease [Bacteroidia bacterium]MDW8416584.1 ABC transporter permease [Bacteroidia bacterium]